MATTAPAGTLRSIFFRISRAAIVGEADFVELDRARETRQHFGARLVHDFFGQIEESEHLRGGARGLQEKLVGAADALDRLVSLEQRVDENAEQADGHAADLDFVASDQQDRGDHHAAEQIHQRRSGGPGAAPVHVFAQQVARRFAEFADFETLHAEGFHHAVAAHGFLQDLAQVRQARAASLRRAANAPAEFAHRPDHQGNQDRGAQRHAPIDDQQDGDEADEIHDLAEEIREPFGKRAAHLLDIADDRGHHAAHRIVLEETDRLLNDFAIGVVPQIHDARKADVLNEHAAEIFRRAFDEEQENDRYGENVPDVVNVARHKGVESDRRGSCAGW